jgi:hypothetical protein
VSCWAFSTEWQHYRTAITRYNITFISYFYFIFLNFWASHFFCVSRSGPRLLLCPVWSQTHTHTTQFVDLSLSHYISFSCSSLYSSLSLLYHLFVKKRFLGCTLELQWSVNFGWKMGKRRIRERKGRKKERKKKKKNTGRALICYG